MTDQQAGNRKTRARPKAPWCAIPARAMSDAALTGLSFRVLMAIAWHDRFNRNGRGCYASQETLARECDTHRKSLYDAITLLKKRGYITEAPDPKDGRRRVYRVVYHVENVRSTDRTTPMAICGLAAADLAREMRSGNNSDDTQVIDSIDEVKRNIFSETVDEYDATPKEGEHLNTALKPAKPAAPVIDAKPFLDAIEDRLDAGLHAHKQRAKLAELMGQTQLPPDQRERVATLLTRCGSKMSA